MIHLGNLIKQRLQEIGMNKSELARRINTTPQNVYGIFKRKSIDTELLRKISNVLEYDFFQHYTQENLSVKEGKVTYKTKGKKITPKTLTVLQEELNICMKELDILKKENIYLKEINDLLKEKLEK